MEPEAPELCFAEKFFGRPLTRAGWWALGLAIAFVSLFTATILWNGRPGSPNVGFVLDPLNATLVFATALCGIGGGVASGIGIFMKRERSLALFLILILGTLVALYAGAELLE